MIGIRQQLIHSMGYDDNRPSLFPAEPLQKANQFCAADRVQRRRRLIQHDDIRVHGQHRSNGCFSHLASA
ncbi:hypothetical protein D3C80_1920150 [compost metagenome]